MSGDKEILAKEKKAITQRLALSLEQVEGSGAGHEGDRIMEESVSER